MFTCYPYFPGITHIRDEMGVCFTLLEGESHALLFDCGYGTEDVAAFVRTRTSLPLTVLLSHGHHDHALGARWFDHVLLHARDLPVYHRYTDLAQRETVLEQANAKGLHPTDFLAGVCPEPDTTVPDTFHLGGLTVRVLHAPGHTPGSLMLYVDGYRLLLTGDNWNPETWCFFPEAPAVQILRQSLQGVLDLPFEHAVCPHATDLFPREILVQDVNAMTDAALRAAELTDHGDRFHIRTCRLSLPGHHSLVFDQKKARAASGDMP